MKTGIFKFKYFKLLKEAKRRVIKKLINTRVHVKFRDTKLLCVFFFESLTLLAFFGVFFGASV